ncbi:MAG: hypothetical protein KC621_34865, partial [Myxococcales bacterium]|nr:hypothetical protein [Myxococcales bacterium]
MADALRRILEDTDWSTASAEDLRRLVDALRAREVVAGVTDLHREASERVLPALPHHVEHSRPHRRALTCARLSPCGRWLATASMPAPDAWETGGVLAIWELANGRVLGTATEISGGVGWGDEAGDLAWIGRSLVAVHNTNQLGRFAPQHGTWLLEADFDLTDGQDHPPPFVVSPDGRHVAVGTWGPEDHGPVARVDLDVGARWSPRDPVPDGCTWTRAAVPRPRRLLWTDRGIVGLSNGVAFRLDRDTLALGWSIALSPVAPTALTRDHLFVATSQLVWVDLTSGEPVGALPLDGEVRGLVPSPHHADRVAVLFDEAVWLVEGGAVRSRLALAPAHASTRRFPDAPAVAFGPDGDAVAVRTADQVVRCRLDGTEVHRHTVPA